MRLGTQALAFHPNPFPLGHAPAPCRFSAPVYDFNCAEYLDWNKYSPSGLKPGVLRCVLCKVPGCVQPRTVGGSLTFEAAVQAFSRPPVRPRETDPHQQSYGTSLHTDKTLQYNAFCTTVSVCQKPPKPSDNCLRRHWAHSRNWVPTWQWLAYAAKNRCAPGQSA